MSKISENQPARIAKIVEKWKNFAKGFHPMEVDFKDKKDDPLTCSHNHCKFWRSKHAGRETKIISLKKISKTFEKELTKLGMRLTWKSLEEDD